MSKIVYKIKELISRIQSERETFLILRDKGLVKAVKQGEKDLEEGGCFDWKDVKKELHSNHKQLHLFFGFK